MSRFVPAIFLVGVVAAPGFLEGQDSVSVAVPLAPNAWVVHGPPGGTIVAVQAANGLIVVDAQSGETSPAILEAIREVTDGRVRLVINTHYHEDHVGGNSLFREAGALVVAHAAVPDLARVDTTISELGWHREAADADDLPSSLIESDTTLTIGAVRVTLLALPAAHTAGDLAVHFPDLDLVHTGDIVEMDAYPFVDWWGGGTLRGTVAAVDRLLGIVGSETRIVPGHGRVVDRSAVEDYRTMLVTVAARVQRAIVEGRTLEETMGSGLSAEWDEARGGERAGRRFVGLLYLGLSSE